MVGQLHGRRQAPKQLLGCWASADCGKRYVGGNALTITFPDVCMHDSHLRQVFRAFVC